MTNTEYVRHDLSKAIRLLMIGFTKTSEYMSDEDVIMRTAFETLITLKQNIERWEVL